MGAMPVSSDAIRHAALGRLRAVLFDFAETLFQPEETASRVQGGIARLGREPLPVPDVDRLASQIEADLESEHYLSLRPRQDLTTADHRNAFTAAFTAAETFAAGLADAMYDRLLEPDAWRPFPEAEPTLRSLRDLGMKIGVVSNIGFDIRPVFARHGLIDLIDAFALSFEHGAVKPDPALFERATEALGVAATETLMVGDNVADAGAVVVGIRVLLLPPVVPGSLRHLDDVIALVATATRQR
jgi:HAD superfamily hydrolase (TIGR01549 family)